MHDWKSTPTCYDAPHRFSIDAPIPGSRRVELDGGAVTVSGRSGSGTVDDDTADWNRARMRGTATQFFLTRKPGAWIRASFSGRAVSIVFPVDFIPPGPHYHGVLDGRFRVRIDGEDRGVVSAEDGRETLLAGNLDAGTHRLDIECLAGGSGWGIEAIREWDSTPAMVSGRIDGDGMLTDLRADVVAGSVRFSKTVRNARTGKFSIPIPATGEASIVFRAMGWREHPVHLEDVSDTKTLHLPPIRMERRAISPQPAVELKGGEPLVLVCFAHVNIWGQEAAEWLARRVEWINAQHPHIVLDANEVNPVYVAGALEGVNAPWVICSGNHSMDGFDGEQDDAHRDVRVAPARVLTAGKDIQDADQFESRFAAFSDDDSLRIICGYEPTAPADLLKRYRVRFYFFGHSLTKAYYWQAGDTHFLRKVDANTFYRVEIGPPYTINAPVRVDRFVFTRDQ